MSSIKPLEDYEKEELERVSGKRQADKDLTNQQFDTNEQTIKENYGGQIEDAKEEYEQLFRENRVQKLINERQIAENMANLGLTDSGLNRTQMTANQLSYSNNNAEYSRQRQKAVEKLNTTMNQYLTQNEIDRNAAINKIDKDYDDKAYSDAVSRYATAVEAENDRINAQISANTAAEKNRTSALNSLHTKLMDGKLNDEQKRALIKNTYLQDGIYEDEISIISTLSGVPEEQIRADIGLIDDYTPPPPPKALNEQTWEAYKITRANWGGGIDNNSEVRSKETGEIIRLDKLKNKLMDDLNMTEQEAKLYILDLQNKIGIKF